MRFLIVLIKTGSESSSELKRQGERDKDLPGREMSTMTVAWSDITIGLYEHELTEGSNLLSIRKKSIREKVP